MVPKICCPLFPSCELSVWQLRHSRQVYGERKVPQDGHVLLLQFWLLASFPPLPSHSRFLKDLLALSGGVRVFGG